MVGSDSTLGFPSRCFAEYDHDAVVVKALRNAGAIPFVKTNVPQVRYSLCQY
jgi:Asp-tRNA(Asn)/Glu-tRNA(Gln) amidotransferase A subunit family amidase